MIFPSGSTMTLPPGLIQRLDVRKVLRLEGQIVGDVVLAHGLAAADDDRASFLGDVTHRREPRLAPIPRRRHVDLRAPRGERVAGQRHVVLPADQPADAAERKRVDREVAAVSAPPDQPLAAGRNQLAVLPEDGAVGTDVEQRVEERGVARLGVALVDADRDGDARRSAPRRRAGRSTGSEWRWRWRAARRRPRADPPCGRAG